MAEATKTLIKKGVVGDMRYYIYELTNLANTNTITTPLKRIYSVSGVNEGTADKPFGSSLSGGVITAIVSTTADEYRIMALGI